ncbi:Pcl10p [Nakaseomyces bracarensis]|uniref:Pcl10p n=1 Tax=Nakaseomyces bracarensis TaxID=273131 RepID=UPI0038721E5E
MSDFEEESDYMELPLKHHRNALIDSSNDNFSELKDDWDQNRVEDQSNDNLTKKVRFEREEDTSETMDHKESQSPAVAEHKYENKENQEHTEDDDDDGQFILHAPGHVRLTRNNNFDNDFILNDRSQTSSTVSNKVDVEELIRAASEVNDYLSQNLDKISSFRSDLLSSTDFTRSDNDAMSSEKSSKHNSGLLSLGTSNLSGSLSNFELSDNDDSERDSDALKNYVMNRENLLSSSTSVGSQGDFGWRNRSSSTSLSKLLNTSNFEDVGNIDINNELFGTKGPFEFNLKELLQERKQRLEADSERAEVEKRVENFQSSTMLGKIYAEDNAEFPEVETEKALQIFKENIELMVKFSTNSDMGAENASQQENNSESDDTNTNTNTNNDNEEMRHDANDNNDYNNIDNNTSEPQEQSPNNDSLCTMRDLVIEGKFEIVAKEVLNFTMKSTPSVTPEGFLQRIQSKCNFGAVIYLTAAYLLQILVLTRDTPESKIRIRLRLRYNEVHRLIIATMRVAAKLVEDFVHSHEYFSKVCGVSKKLLSKLEVSLVMCIKNEELMITNEKLSASLKILDELRSGTSH